MNKRTTICGLILALTINSQSISSAAVILLEWSGTLTRPEYGHDFPLFGVEERTAPYRFTVTYDTALAPAPSFTAAGSVYLHPIYSYSADGVVATSLTFGTKTWTTSDLTDDLNFGMPNPILFDADIASAAPTRYFLNFSRQSAIEGLLYIGATGGGFVKHLHPRIDLYNEPAGYPGYVEGRDYAPTFTATVVPEPSVAAMLLLGFTALGLRRRSQGHA
jgi:hypothetical protein